MSTTRRWILLANAAALVIWIALAAAVQSRLPAEMVTKIDFSGHVTARTATSVFGWYTLPAIATLMFVMLAVIAHIAASRPQLFNIPQKARMLALPDAERRAVSEVLATAICALGLWEFLLFALIHWGLYRASTDPGSGVGTFLTVALFVFVGVTTLAIGFGLVKLSAYIRDVEQQVAARQGALRAT